MGAFLSHFQNVYCIDIYPTPLTYNSICEKNIPENLVVFLSKYRLSNHKLLIEQGRYNGTIRSAHLCRLNNLGEYHFYSI